MSLGLGKTESEVEAKAAKTAEAAVKEADAAAKNAEAALTEGRKEGGGALAQVPISASLAIRT